MLCYFCNQPMDHRGCQDEECQRAMAAEAKAEMDAENGWLRAAEYDQESQDQMYRDDAMGFS